MVERTGVLRRDIAGRRPGRLCQLPLQVGSCNCAADFVGWTKNERCRTATDVRRVGVSWIRQARSVLVYRQHLAHFK